jgi:hypothetical protein
MSICGGGAQSDSSKLSDWLQVIGLFAVVASLIFVGLQMKQTDAIALSEIYQERAVASREHNLINSSNPNFLSGSVIYLSSRAGAYVHGAVIPVDGGTSVNHQNS